MIILLDRDLEPLLVSQLDSLCDIFERFALRIVVKKIKY